jgi:hypothetical protein
MRLRVSPAAGLPENLRDGCELTIGAAAEGTESLHPTHPIVVAAVDAARAKPEGRYHVECRLDAGAPPDLVRRRGSRGRLILVSVRYGGFEPLEEILPIVLLEGETSPLAEDLANALMWSDLRDVDAKTPSRLSDEDVADAIEECLFLREAPRMASERDRFERAIAQIERFVDDRVILRKRRRDELLKRIAAVEAKRDAAIGPDARTEAEAHLAKLQEEVEAIEAEIAKLENREDAEFVRLREDVQARRFASRIAEPLLEADVVIALTRRTT